MFKSVVERYNKEEIKCQYILVWVYSKAVITEKPLKEKLTNKIYFNDNYN
tara:strand:+ start:182 stop:331 length:150 start_codon:yes stop_codon:yes gene_type:complete